MFVVELLISVLVLVVLVVILLLLVVASHVNVCVVLFVGVSSLISMYIVMNSELMVLFVSTSANVSVMRFEEIVVVSFSAMLNSSISGVSCCIGISC